MALSSLVSLDSSSFSFSSSPRIFSSKANVVGLVQMIVTLVPITPSYRVKVVAANLVKAPLGTVVRKVIHSFVPVAIPEAPGVKLALVVLRIRKWASNLPCLQKFLAYLRRQPLLLISRQPTHLVELHPIPVRTLNLALGPPNQSFMAHCLLKIIRREFKIELAPFEKNTSME